MKNNDVKLLLSFTQLQKDYNCLIQLLNKKNEEIEDLRAHNQRLSDWLERLTPMETVD